jgi:YVTN family beta-propeller protein
MVVAPIPSVKLQNCSVPRTRLYTAITLVVVIAIAGVVLLVKRSNDTDTKSSARPASARTESTDPPAKNAPPTTKPAPATTTTVTTPHDPNRTFTLTPVTTIRGNISPKSVTATETGLVTAQNMMYTHTITVYDQDGKLVKTIPDAVDLASYGYTGHPGLSKGAPVEAAVDSAHQNIYASNYSMYGANFGPEGNDNCGGPSGLSPSYLYRVNLNKLAIDGVAQVGMVPKYVAVTPNDKYVLATNWCSYDMSVVDRATFKEVKRIPLGAYPRGIVVNKASNVAYVAVMGSYNVARVDLNNFTVTNRWAVGSSPRHVVLSPDGSRLYVTLNGAGQIAAVNTATGQVVGRLATGSQPRSMAISSDGRALYVVNYNSSTVSVVRASDLSLVKTIPVPSHPIGITYEPVKHRVWVACYSGEILVYDA